MKSDAESAAAPRDGDECAAQLLPDVACHAREAAAALYKAHVSREEQRAGVDAAAEAVLRVHRVVWTHKQLRHSSVVEIFLNVTHVYLSHNELDELDGLQLLMHLRVLVVAHNALVSTRAVALLPELYYLDVQHNKIAQLDAAVDLPCATLRCLYMDANPCCIHVGAAEGGDMAAVQTRTQHDDDNEDDNDADDKCDARTRLARHVRAVCGDILEYLDLEHTGNTPREAAAALEDSDVDDNDDDDDVYSDGVAAAKTASLLLLHNNNDGDDEGEGEEDEYHGRDAAEALYVPHTRRRLQHVRQVDAHYRRCYGSTVPRAMPASTLPPASNNTDDKLNRNDDSSRRSSRRSSSSSSGSRSETHEERVDDGACRCVRDEMASLTATTTTQWRGDAERLWQQYATRAASRCALVLRHAAQHTGDNDDDDDAKNGNCSSSRTSERDDDHHDNDDEYAARARTRGFAPLTVDDHDALVEARQLQSSMYADVTCAMRQHDAQARRALAAQWASMERVMQTSHGVAAERRRCQHAASMTQSSSYADALRLLVGESLHKDIRAYTGTTRDART